MEHKLTKEDVENAYDSLCRINARSPYVVADTTAEDMEDLLKRLRDLCPGAKIITAAHGQVLRTGTALAKSDMTLFDSLGMNSTDDYRAKELKAPYKDPRQKKHCTEQPWHKQHKRKFHK